MSEVRLRWEGDMGFRVVRALEGVHPFKIVIIHPTLALSRRSVHYAVASTKSKLLRNTQADVKQSECDLLMNVAEPSLFVRFGPAA
jgi:hypothetical protein